MLNVPAGSIRPNLVSVAAGADMTWSMFNERGTHDIIFDASGYWHPTSGGKVTPLKATVPVLDTQAGIGGSKAAVEAAEGALKQVSGREAKG